MTWSTEKGERDGGGGGVDADWNSSQVPDQEISRQETRSEELQEKVPTISVHHCPCHIASLPPGTSV